MSSLIANRKALLRAGVDSRSRGADIRVWPEGRVEIWKVMDENIGGYWDTYPDYEDCYEEILAAGMDVFLPNDLF